MIAKETWTKIDAITNRVVARSQTQELLPEWAHAMIVHRAVALAKALIEKRWRDREDALVWGE